jgi:hypothetical protein
MNYRSTDILARLTDESGAMTTRIGRPDRISLSISFAFILAMTGCAFTQSTGGDPETSTGDNREIIFVTKGSAFAPLIVVDGNAEILWTFSDGTTSNSCTPNVSFGADGDREQRLKVTPWSALKGIDLGYDGGDGGRLNALYQKADQSVGAV